MATQTMSLWESAVAFGERTVGFARRILPPLVADTAAAVRGMTATDPFDRLIAEHRQVDAMLQRLTDAVDAPNAYRIALFMRYKRAITKHSLAEEDIVYPALHDEVRDEAGSKSLYEEHAEIKILTAEVEHALMDEDPNWQDRVRSLHEALARHMRHEEEEEFPKMRSVLDEDRQRAMSVEIRREERMVI
jgi:hemerythrin superfamily protein